METIYIDVLIVLNIYVNYFLLRITAGLTHSPLRTWRCVSGAVWGSLFSLTILLPELGTVIPLLIKLMAAVSVVMISFGIRGKKRLFINTLAFFAANFVLAGTVYGAYSLLKPRSMHYRNGSFYIDFSLLILIVTTAALYFALRLIRIITDKAPVGSYHVLVRSGKKILNLSGLADTGNVLVDYFTGSPVIICSDETFSELTGKELDISLLPKGFRLLPCTAVSGSGLIPVFRPDEVLIYSDDSGERKAVDALIGFGECGGKAVFNPKLLKI
ncbi:sigma-E processing peptidase SpoIIGA [Ruminococcus sp.]|uniref:sigma-E processing peptidase SpoIIGA n=1 Tax=Ruminococcus sp. TaxID=41978 RepID=UPI0025CBD3AB|nr:sigma-E processing peptidase SpoIIGA [Ruminococcus sp.]MCR4638057.1 sigma-E processing peptidase SpoIIGA [Ruminococcus sp.]